MLLLYKVLFVCLLKTNDVLRVQSAESHRFHTNVHIRPVDHQVPKDGVDVLQVALAFRSHLARESQLARVLPVRLQSGRRLRHAEQAKPDSVRDHLHDDRSHAYHESGRVDRIAPTQVAFARRRQSFSNKHFYFAFEFVFYCFIFSAQILETLCNWMSDNFPDALSIWTFLKTNLSLTDTIMQSNDVIFQLSGISPASILSFSTQRRQRNIQIEFVFFSSTQSLETELRLIPVAFEYVQAFKLLCVNEGAQWTRSVFLNEYTSAEISSFTQLAQSAADNTEVSESDRAKAKQLAMFYLYVQVSVICHAEAQTTDEDRTAWTHVAISTAKSISSKLNNDPNQPGLSTLFSYSMNVCSNEYKYK